MIIIIARRRTTPRPQRPSRRPQRVCQLPVVMVAVVVLPQPRLVVLLPSVVVLMVTVVKVMQLPLARVIEDGEGGTKGVKVLDKDGWMDGWIMDAIALLASRINQKNIWGYIHTLSG